MKPFSKSGADGGRMNTLKRRPAVSPIAGCPAVDVESISCPPTGCSRRARPCHSDCRTRWPIQESLRFTICSNLICRQTNSPRPSIPGPHRRVVADTELQAGRPLDQQARQGWSFASPRRDDNEHQAARSTVEAVAASPSCLLRSELLRTASTTSHFEPVLVNSDRSD